MRQQYKTAQYGQLTPDNQSTNTTTTTLNDLTTLEMYAIDTHYPRISVIIPTRNEEKNLHHVLPFIPTNVYEVILVDGHSTDKTIEVARELLPNIRIIHQLRKGKGDALRIGFAACSGDIVVMIDADGSTDPREIPAFIDALLAGHDFAKGSRYISGGGSHDITFLRNLGNSALGTLVNVLFQTNYSDLCYGYNAFWRRCLEHITIDCDGFEVETQMNIRAQKAGLDIVEVPSMERPRLFGQSNLRTIRDGWRVLKMIAKERITSEPQPKHQVPILMYHSISDTASPRFKQFAVPQRVFAKHMEYLYHNGYTPITVSQYVEAQAHNGAGLPARPIVLTFDDGFADFYSAALPVLNQYDFTATLYVATGYINDYSRWLFHEGEAQRPMLTWEQLAKVNARGIECGGHSQHHPQLDTLPGWSTWEEIVQSKLVLEEHLCKKITSFAYPFGYYTQHIRRQVKDAGYTSACTVKHAMSSDTTDPFALSRWMVYPTTTINDLDALLAGQSISTLSMLYLRARTPIYQMARRGSATIARQLQGSLAIH
jgi:Predicted xylanase/chitin deacetylase